MQNMNVTCILSPVIFVVIIGFIAKLGYDNQILTQRNERLRLQNTELMSKNTDLAGTIKTLAAYVGEQNEIVRAETKRRAAAEMKQQGLQDEVKQVLRDSTCSVVLVPDDVTDKLRDQADSVRSGKGSAAADTGKPAK